MLPLFAEKKICYQNSILSWPKHTAHIPCTPSTSMQKERCETALTTTFWLRQLQNFVGHSGHCISTWAAVGGPVGPAGSSWIMQLYFSQFVAQKLICLLVPSWPGSKGGTGRQRARTWFQTVCLQNLKQVSAYSKQGLVHGPWLAFKLMT